MSGRSDTSTLHSFGEAGEHRVGLPGQHAAYDPFGQLLVWARTDFDGAGQRDHARTADRPQRPAVGDLAQAFGQTLDAIGKCVRRVELDDALDKNLAADLNAAGGADGLGPGNEDARVVDVAGPRTDRVEVRQDVPDLLRGSRNGAGAVDVGHRLTVTGSASPQL